MLLFTQNLIKSNVRLILILHFSLEKKADLSLLFMIAFKIGQKISYHHRLLKAYKIYRYLLRKASTKNTLTHNLTFK